MQHDKQKNQVGQRSSVLNETTRATSCRTSQNNPQALLNYHDGLNMEKHTQIQARCHVFVIDDDSVFLFFIREIIYFAHIDGNNHILSNFQLTVAPTLVLAAQLTNPVDEALTV